MKGGYFKGKLTFEYVSEVSLKGLDLRNVDHECDVGGAIGSTTRIEEQEIDRAEADELAIEYGSDDTFFGDKDGDEER